MITPKVFCIGFHKTGTTSVGLALQQLGYRLTGPNGVHDEDISKNVYRMAYELAEQYDAFQDNPWPILYREMDERYPGSKFILMLRSPESWIRSQLRHFGREETPMRTWIYGVGCPEGNEDVYLRRFVEHNNGVLEYFSHRPDDLLVMELARGDGWEKLCGFLGKPMPATTFPHANTAENRERRQARSRTLVGRMRAITSRIVRRSS